MEKLERIQWRITKMIRGLENLAHEGMLKEINGFVQPREEKAQGAGVGV